MPQCRGIRAFDRLKRGEPTQGLELGIGVSIVAMAATMGVMMMGAAHG